MNAAISVVTPVLDGAEFIETAVRSVLEQRDVDLEYIVVDGGSTDGTLERLRAFEPRVRVVRHAGNQAEAINYGASLAGGRILAILNADDWYLPGALALVARAFDGDPAAGVIYGCALVADRSGATIGRSEAEPFSLERLQRGCPIVQPAAFIRAATFAEIGGMTPSNRYTCDYDLWLRLAHRSPFRAIDATLAVTRDHAGNKSWRARRPVIEEAMASLRAEYGYVPYSWVFAYASTLLARRDRTTNGARRTAAVVLSLVLGVSRNPRQAGRYVREWWSYRAAGRRRAAAH